MSGKAGGPCGRELLPPPDVAPVSDEVGEWGVLSPVPGWPLGGSVGGGGSTLPFAGVEEDPVWGSSPLFAMASKNKGKGNE